MLGITLVVACSHECPSLEVGEDIFGIVSVWYVPHGLCGAEVKGAFGSENPLRSEIRLFVRFEFVVTF